MYAVSFSWFIAVKQQLHRTPTVAAKEPFDADSDEFNSAYSIQVTANSDPSETDHTTMDTFEHILQMTSHHEAVYAYYYMEDNNKVGTICMLLW